MIKNIEKKLFESKYSKVSGFSKNGGILKVLIESEEFEISEDENGINMMSNGVDMTAMTEEEADEQLGLLTESQSVVDKKDLANILSINNVKGRLIKDADVPDAVLVKFNKALPSFVKKYPKFDLFGDDYDGSETDEFVELLITASKGTKVDLFENADSMVDEVVASENPEEKLTDIQNNDIPLMEAKSARVGGFAKSKLVESLGNPFKTDTLAYKIKKGVKLTESASPSKYKSSVGKMWAETLNLIWAWYAGKATTEQTKKNLLIMSKKYEEADPYDVFEDTVDDAFKGKSTPDNPSASNSVFMYFCDTDNLEGFVEADLIDEREVDMLEKDVRTMRQDILKLSK